MTLVRLLWIMSLIRLSLHRFVHVYNNNNDVVLSPLFHLATAEFIPSQSVHQTQNENVKNNVIVTNNNLSNDDDDTASRHYNNKNNNDLSVNDKHLLLVQIDLNVTVSYRYNDTTTTTTTNTAPFIPSFDSNDSINSSTGSNKMMNDERFMITIDEFHINQNDNVETNDNNNNTKKQTMTTIEYIFYSKNELQCNNNNNNDQKQSSPSFELLSFHCTNTNGKLIHIVIPTTHESSMKTSSSSTTTTTFIVGLWRVLNSNNNNNTNTHYTIVDDDNDSYENNQIILLTKQLVHISKYEMIVPVLLHTKYSFYSNNKYYRCTTDSNDVISKRNNHNTSSHWLYINTIRCIIIYIVFLIITFFSSDYHSNNNKCKKKKKKKKNPTLATTPSSNKLAGCNECNSNNTNNDTTDDLEVQYSIIQNSRPNSEVSDTCNDDYDMNMNDDDEKDDENDEDTMILLRPSIEIDSSDDEDDLSPPYVERCISSRHDVVQVLLHHQQQHQHEQNIQFISKITPQSMILETIQVDSTTTTELETVNHESELQTTKYHSIEPLPMMMTMNMTLPSDSLHLNIQQHNNQTKMYTANNDVQQLNEVVVITNSSYKSNENHRPEVVDTTIVDPKEDMFHYEINDQSILPIKSVITTNVMFYDDDDDIELLQQNCHHDVENIITKNHLKDNNVEDKIVPTQFHDDTLSFEIKKLNSSTLSPGNMDPNLSPLECNNKEQNHTLQTIVDNEDYIYQNLSQGKNIVAQCEIVVDSNPIVATNTSDPSTTELTPIGNTYQDDIILQNVVTASIDVYDGNDTCNDDDRPIRSERSVEYLELFPTEEMQPKCLDEIQPKRLDFIDTLIVDVSKHNHVLLETIEICDNVKDAKQNETLKLADIIVSAIPTADVSIPEINEQVPNYNSASSPYDYKAITLLETFDDSTDGNPSRRSRKKRQRSRFGGKDVELTTSSKNSNQKDTYGYENDSMKQKQMSPDFSYVSTLPPNSIRSDDTLSFDRYHLSDTVPSGQCNDRLTNNNEEFMKGMTDPIFGSSGTIVTKSIDKVHLEALSTTLDELNASASHVKVGKRFKSRKRSRNVSSHQVVIPNAPISNSLLLAIEEMKENVWIFDEDSVNKSFKKNKKTTKRHSLPKAIQVCKNEQGYL